MHIKRAISILLTIPLCGCVAAWGQTYHIESETPSSIVIKYDPSLTNIRNIQVVAEDYCQKSNKNAAPNELTTSMWAISTVSFTCRKISATEQANIAQREIAQQSRERAATAMMLSGVGASMQSLGDTYKANAAAYGNAASCPACQQGAQAGADYAHQQQQEQQQEQQRQQMEAQQQQLQQQQNEINRLNSRSPAERLFDCSQTGTCAGVFAPNR